MFKRILDLLRGIQGRPQGKTRPPAAGARPSGPTHRSSGARATVEQVSEEEGRLLELAVSGHTFRRTDAGEEGFDAVVERLRSLRDRGLIRLEEGRIMQAHEGGYMMAGPVDLTDAGRLALEHDLRLGSRIRRS